MGDADITNTRVATMDFAATQATGPEAASTKPAREMINEHRRRSSRILSQHSGGCRADTDNTCHQKGDAIDRQCGFPPRWK